jgi:transposase
MMCLKPRVVGDIPEESARIARSAFPNGNRYMTLRNELGTVFSDEQFVALFERRGQAAESPWRLALVSVPQFLEDLSDRQAADAVRALCWTKNTSILSSELTRVASIWRLLSTWHVQDPADRHRAAAQSDCTAGGFSVDHGSWFRLPFRSVQAGVSCTI